MNGRKYRIWLGFILVLVLIYAAYANRINILHISNLAMPLYQEPPCEYPQLVSAQDQNQNGIPDSMDVVSGARQEVARGTIYDGAYFQGGYPPEGRGACTDVIWRAFKTAGYDLKKMVDADIRNNPQAYGATGRRPDPNIDFRRVSNLQIFFQRHGQELTLDIIPGDVNNLANWQPGDIVVFGRPLEHIGIISDKRGIDGVPLMIHNCGPQAGEDSYYLQNWPSSRTHHFRFIELQEG
ncbi:MAG: DUF1287 domain-containing protein [Syntrophomonadaceae bacterium]|nr:DUF1287 domain-containing protein [Syntrophomonadaceae bacterium]